MFPNSPITRIIKTLVFALLLSCLVLLIFSPDKKSSETIIEVATNTKNNISIFDTCPLTVYDHLDPQLRQFHNPRYNPMAGCTPYIPLTVLENGKIRATEKAEGYECSASYCFIESFSVPHRLRMATSNTSLTGRYPKPPKQLPPCFTRRKLDRSPGFGASPRGQGVRRRLKCIYNDHDTKYIADPWIILPSNETFKCDIVESQCSNGNFFYGNESYLHMQIYEDESLPHTLAYLKMEHGAIQMEFLNKLGYNSRPNAIALFFGRTEEGGSRDLVGQPPLYFDWDSTKMCKEYLDDLPYELEEYRKLGYKTMVAQDWSAGFAYYPNCLGFNRSEADHMWRAFELRMGESRTLRRSHIWHCSELHLEMMAYMEKFMQSYPGVPKICHVWPVNLAHDSMKNLYHADEQFLNFFKRNTKHLDDSFLFFMGDHGPKSEGIEKVPLGEYEQKNPFLMVSVPKRYRNTPIHNQLKLKSTQLMTHYDLHATFLDILKVGPTPKLCESSNPPLTSIFELQPSSNFSDTSYRDMGTMSKGSSLLREWRGPRNCRTLPIPSHYCICQYNKTTIDNEAILAKTGQFVAEQVNQILRKAGILGLCRVQSYYS
ncbi:unnamed protein product, partial [Haemonchus placei]|uniref:Sulfatase domain-containing protein n=1 Tax=Haemonchus placei TaxID=6290 RepID=A0A158QNC7_HAEPC